jgi:acyl-CoA oxidase
MLPPWDDALFYAAIAYVMVSVYRFLQSRAEPSLVVLRSTDRSVEPEIRNLVQALNKAPCTDDEGDCAEQIRDIVIGEHLSYQMLEREPSALLRASRHVDTENGSLYTRFTVQYNLYAGTIVALGSQNQRDALYATQASGDLGCFAFTECGAGVLSGAGVETTATLDEKKGVIIVHTPVPSARKNWISQGMFAERAVILANLIVRGENKGPHIFWTRIADRVKGSKQLKSVKGVKVERLGNKTALLGLDNAFVSFDHFEIQVDALLSRFSRLQEDSESNDGESKGQYEYKIELPKGAKRMLDVLISRLLTGRICLSEFTVGYAMMMVRRSWKYTLERELWRGKKEHGEAMSSKPHIKEGFDAWSKALTVVQHYLACTREDIGKVRRCPKYHPALYNYCTITDFCLRLSARGS